MQENGGEQLLWKLFQLFRGKEDLISSGRIQLCLSATIISFLNKCFDDKQQFCDFQKHNLEFLKLRIQNVRRLKIIPGPTFKYNSIVDISHFKSVQILEITKIAIRFISGLQTLRQKIRILRTHQSIDKINDVLASCGSDQSMEFLWPKLEEANFRFNKISHLDSSLRLLTSLKSLNLSHNELGLEKDNWMYLPEVKRLDISSNQLTKIPLFTGNFRSRITILILENNDLASLEGVDVLSNLEVLDVSTNCITDFHFVTPLLRLNRLVSLSLRNNPISYHKQYRLKVVSCLSHSRRHVPILFDGQELSAQELHKLGSSSNVDVIPPRSYQSPVYMNYSSQDSTEASLQTSTELLGTQTPEEKRRGRKSVIRQPSIRNTDEEQVTTSISSDDNILEANEEFQKLEKFKKDTGEDYLLVRNQQQLKDVEVAAVVHTSTDPETNAKGTSDQENDFLENPASSKTKIQSIHEDEENDRLFLVSVKLPTTEEDVHQIVTIKQHFIMERDINLKEICTIDLNSLLDVKMIPTVKHFTVQLKFDYLNKEKKFREYMMEDESSCERFVALVKDFVTQPDNDKVTLKKLFKCLKCSACYTMDENLSVCHDCGSSMVIEVTQDFPVKNASPQSKSDSLRPETLVQNDPDLIPKAVNNLGAPPDICVNSLQGDHSEYGALVSSIQLKSKDLFTQNTFTEERQTDNACKHLWKKGRETPSPAVDISPGHSSPGVVKSLYYKLRQSSISDSALESSTSSLSGSDSRTSNPLGGRSLKRIDFSSDSCTHCDHRLKLYFETRMFNGGDEELFCCMLKCPLVSYGSGQGVPSLLVISNFNAYICKISGFECSSKPKEWLSVKVSYQLTDLRYLEYGLQSQSFRLEFAQPSGCHTYLVGDKERCEDFLSTLQVIVEKACHKIKKPLIIGKVNPQTLANIRMQVFGVMDESLMFKGQRLYEQAVNFTDPPLVKDNKNWFRTLPQSMLGREFIDWLISHKEASNYRKAVQVGQLLLDAGVIQCFNKDCRFLEKDEYYHFNLSEGILKSKVDDLPQENVTESSDIDPTIRQYVLAHWMPWTKNKDMEAILPISVIVSNSHIALAKENHQWPLPRFHEPPVTLSGPQFVFLNKQKITNITDVELFTDCRRDIGIEFHDEDTPGNIGDDRWLLIMETEFSVESFLNHIKELWEEKFGVEMPLEMA